MTRSDDPTVGKARRVRKVFTDRNGGASAEPFGTFNLGDHVGDDLVAVAANRERLSSLLGVDLVFMEQIHSPNVTEVTAATVAGNAGEAGTDSANGTGITVETTDALITTVPRVGLVVLTADCVPLLLSDEDAGVIAAVHAGRMGARNGIVRRTVDRMEQLGAIPANIHVLMGAAASGANYEVPDAMAADVESKLPGSKTRTSKGTTGLDIRAGLTRQLLSMGVRSIDADPRCTIESPNFFSYRREGKTGRQAGVVWME
ncbi:copper oxidase [Corynebacterium falsenii DSM 44353]|uniref:peptidoglycan editing factor PgeF n=1 Tax=Corynebacterium falsenii TaxID=108486 RepID=UPI0003E93DDF|nr:peptidoglycan editing factor PgeF [Corynebacterium falsenii]AHI02936.1 copper oxidase [Corynebacterium falsenii DSM 44353]UBI03648.1 peptidoglycan editing factor PgeF [Corynebacterium falsenii]